MLRLHVLTEHKVARRRSSYFDQPLPHLTISFDTFESTCQRISHYLTIWWLSAMLRSRYAKRLFFSSQSLPCLSFLVISVSKPSLWLIHWALASSPSPLIFVSAPLISSSLVCSFKYTFTKHRHTLFHVLPHELSFAKRVFCAQLYVWVRQCWMCVSSVFRGEYFITWPWKEWSMHMLSVLHTLICHPHKYAEYTSHDAHTHTHIQANTVPMHVVHIMSLGCSDGLKNNWILRDWENTMLISPLLLVLCITPLFLPFLCFLSFPSFSAIASVQRHYFALPEGELTSCMSQ